MSIRKVIIPIAGLGTRFLPATKVVPKEMLPINGKPIVHLLVEEAVNAGLNEVIFVINKEKETLIKEYFSLETPTSKKIEEKGKQSFLEDLNNLINKVTFHYCHQEEQKGDGHAILQAEQYIEDEPFAVLFGDDIVITPEGTPNALKQLIDAYNQTQSSIIAVEEVPDDQIENYGEIAPKNQNENLYEAESLVEKPKKEEAPSNLGIIGKYIATPEVLKAFKEGESSHGGEIRLIDGYRQIINSQKIYGLLVKGTRYDTGTLDGYRKAISDIS